MSLSENANGKVTRNTSLFRPLFLRSSYPLLKTCLANSGLPSTIFTSFSSSSSSSSSSLSALGTRMASPSKRAYEIHTLTCPLSLMSLSYKLLAFSRSPSSVSKSI